MTTFNSPLPEEKSLLIDYKKVQCFLPFEIGFATFKE